MPRDIRFQDITIKDFSLGVNTDADSSKLAPNEFASCLNMIPNEDGSVSVRPGYWQISSDQIAANKGIKALLAFEDAVFGDLLIAVCDQKVWSVDTAMGTFVDLGLGLAGNYTLPAGVYFRMVQFKGRAYGSAWTGSGTSRMFCAADNVAATSTLKAWRAGVHAPTLAPGAAMGPDGVLLVGTYKYIISYFYGQDGAHGESNQSPTKTFLLGTANKKITVTVLGGAYEYATWDAAHDAGIDKIRIYRTKRNENDFYFVADVTSTLTYDDNVADLDLGTDTIPQTDNYPIAEGLHLCAAQSRLYVGNTVESSVAYPNRVRWCLAGYPDIGPAQNYHDFPAELGSVTGICEVSGQVYVFQRYGLSRLTVTSASEYTTETVCREPCVVQYGKSLVSCPENGVPSALFYSFGGFKRFDGWSSAVIGRPVETYDDYVGYGHAAFDSENYICACASASGGYPTELRYSTVRIRQDRRGYTIGSWWPQHLKAGGLKPSCYAIEFGRIVYMGDPSYGWIYRVGEWATNNKDDQTYLHTGGTVVVGTLTSGDIDFDMPTMQKRLVKIMVESELTGAATFTWTADFGAQTGSFSLNTGTNPTLTEIDISPHVDFRRLRYSITTSGATSFTFHAVTFRIGATRPQ